MRLDRVSYNFIYLFTSQYSSISTDGLRVRFPAGVTYFPLLHSIQTGSEAHPASYPMGIGDWGVKLTIHLHLVLRLRMVEVYLHSPPRLHGIVLN
jgi:hypothetical protein